MQNSAHSNPCSGSNWSCEAASGKWFCTFFFFFFAHCTCPELSLWLTATNLWEKKQVAAQFYVEFIYLNIFSLVAPSNLVILPLDFSGSFQIKQAPISIFVFQNHTCIFYLNKLYYDNNIFEWFSWCLTTWHAKLNQTNPGTKTTIIYVKQLIYVKWLLTVSLYH